MADDLYQERYTAHQARKSEVLRQIMEERHSERVFGGSLTEEEMLDIIELAREAPSSCARQGTYYEIVSDRDRKDILSGLLVGAVGWAHRAPHLILLFADPQAYKAGNEITFNGYLDAGMFGAHIMLIAESMGFKSCYINPAIRDFNKPHFQALFGDMQYCGAIAIGRVKED